jgi:3-dehydroquinate dehydratase-1
MVVGSTSRRDAIASLDPVETESTCDILEIRLDGLVLENAVPDRTIWHAFRQMPLLFTARKPEEGGLNDLDARARMELLEHSLPDASLIDIEAASIPAMLRIVEKASAAKIPWIASFHDFKGMPAEKDLVSALQRAKDAGAAVFKWAAMIHTPSDLARLAEFQQENHGIPVASMGMGPLAVVSRLLCAQCGSVLNYGYLGDEPTAPGQWDAGSLRRAISRLPQV